MLINKLLQQQKLQIRQLAEQGQQRQWQMYAEQQLLKQRCRAFIGSAPGLVLSFSAGCLFQIRHNNIVRTVRSLVGFNWLKSLM
jgi:hypothetical protein